MAFSCSNAAAAPYWRIVTAASTTATTAAATTRRRVCVSPARAYPSTKYPTYGIHIVKNTVAIGREPLPTAALTVYTMVKSRRLSDFLDALSDERLSAGAKVKAFFAVWGREDAA